MDLVESDWAIEFHSGIPVYRQIIHYIQATVAAGRLKEGDQLPTIRGLHKALRVNPNTVAKAYRELEMMGVISTQHGSGSFVAAPKPVSQMPAKVKAAKAQELTARIAAEARSHGISLSQIIQQLNLIKSDV